MKKKYISVLALACLFSASAMAQQKITGVVKDAQGEPVLGALVTAVGDPTEKSITDQKGVFTLNANQGEYIEIVYADSQKKRVWVKGESLEICLEDLDTYTENRSKLQSGREQTQAVSTLSGEKIANNSTFNVGNSLYGMLPGLIVKQNTGWTDGATLMVRGGGSQSSQSPLIVVDGIPRTLNYLNMLEVESISVLKDGAATALWGTRGANGVVVVTTKRGQYNRRDIDVNYTYGMGLPINQPEFVDGVTYAQMRNEALYYDGLPLEYDATAFEAFRNGSNPDAFPNVDWMGTALRDYTTNHQLNLTFRGGGKRVRYYTAINYKNDQGILDTDLVNSTGRYDAQFKKYRLDARMNLDIDVTDYTRVALNMFGLLHENNRPRESEANIFGNLFHVPSGAFPIRTTNGYWGSNNIFKINPIAEIAENGYFRTDERMLQSDLRIYQDLSPVTKGLKAEVGISYDNSAVYQETGSQEYEYEALTVIPGAVLGEYEILRNVGGEEKALSISNGGLNSQFMRLVIDGRVGYDRAFGLHAVNGNLMYRQESYTPLGRNNSRKRQSVIFTGGYNYDNRYLVDVVVNYSGTSVLSDGDKFRTYPAISAAWVLSNESFWKNASNVIDYFKIRASWGRSGNDNIGYDLDERYWVSCGGGLFKDTPAGFGGLHAGNLAVSNLDIELADKYNFGIDMRLFNRLSLTADAFYDKRTNTLISASNLYSSVIGTGIPQLNMGETNSKGLDLGLNWEDKVGENFKYYVGGTFSYLRTCIDENGEGYKPYDYLYKKGDRIGQLYGLEAIGYFRDETDIANSPKQMFSAVRPGDIKYKDQNGDGKIDSYDEVAIGHSSSIPGIYYGINLGFEYKGFGIDAVFQGVGQYSRMLNTQSVYWPLRNNNSNLSKWYLEDRVRWTEDTKGVATAPRLTTLDNANNFRNSTEWLENGAFFKLRNLNIYYNLPKKWISSMKMDQCQVYLRGNNLFSLDHVKYLNCEDLSINYPDLMSVFVGVNINF